MIHNFYFQYKKTNPHNRLFFIRLCGFALSPNNLIASSYGLSTDAFSAHLKSPQIFLPTPFLITQHDEIGVCGLSVTFQLLSS